MTQRVRLQYVATKWRAEMDHSISGGSLLLADPGRLPILVPELAILGRAKDLSKLDGTDQMARAHSAL